MSTKPKILTFAGSIRKESFNKKLAVLAAEIASGEGADAQFVDLVDYQFPIYNGDDEAANGLPEKVKELKAIFAEQDGIIICSPEYNSSVTAVLKNTIDWLSRPEPGENGMVAFAGKLAGIAAASPGALGGLRGLVTLRSILSSIGVLVIPEQAAISSAHQAFNKDGKLTDEKSETRLRAVVLSVVSKAAKLAE